MSEFPDLGLPQTEYFFHSWPSEITEPKEEGIFYTHPGHNLIEDVVTFVGRETQPLASAKYDQKFKKLAPTLAKTCCRLVVLYKLDPINSSCAACGEAGNVWCSQCKKYMCTYCLKNAEVQKCELDTVEHVHNLCSVDMLNAEFTTDLSQKSYTGTAFRVSERMLLTAKHTIKPTHKVTSAWHSKYSRSYSLAKAYVIAAHDALFDALSLYERPDTFEVKLVPDTFNYELNFEKNGWEKPFAWKQAFDFCTVEFVGEKTPSVDLVPIAIPGLSSHQLPPMKMLITDDTPPLRLFAAGYPTKVLPDKFFEDYIPRYHYDVKKAGNTVETYLQYLRECQRKFDEVSNACGGFERVIISFAEHDKLVGVHTALQSHKCPTLRGTSGGIVGYLVYWGSYSVSVFAGMHLGGSAERNGNVFVSNYDPAFALHYARYVLQNPDDATLRAFTLAPLPIRRFIEHHKHTFARFGIHIHAKVIQCTDESATSVSNTNE